MVHANKVLEHFKCSNPYDNAGDQVLNNHFFYVINFIRKAQRNTTLVYRQYTKSKQKQFHLTYKINNSKSSISIAWVYNQHFQDFKPNGMYFDKIIINRTRI